MFKKFKMVSQIFRALLHITIASMVRTSPHSFKLSCLGSIYEKSSWVKINLTLLMEQFQFLLILIQVKAWNHCNMFVHSWIMNFVDESIA
ncbi:hypothetical protein MtrunA17_Chr3g0124101 [Medicago truncatula]|uniref:Uncharacterized protein n=1 Tax=Medicago truncatula TaxID=3880 RepID=A0A396IV05_MEDTR|nr:hypothetical protein MtrunA17_Chr3g0124101 [Medicago truncatula]